MARDSTAVLKKLIEKKLYFSLPIIEIMQAHGAKYACLYCEGERALRAGKMRTFGGIRKRHKQFLLSGGKLRDASKYANAINEPIISEDDDKRVIAVIPPGELHLLIGAVDVHMNLLIRMYGLEYVESLVRSFGAIRHGYQGNIAMKPKNFLLKQQ